MQNVKQISKQDLPIILRKGYAFFWPIFRLKDLYFEVIVLPTHMKQYDDFWDAIESLGQRTDRPAGVMQVQSRQVSKGDDRYFRVTFDKKMTTEEELLIWIRSIFDQ